MGFHTCVKYALVPGAIISTEFSKFLLYHMFPNMRCVIGKILVGVLTDKKTYTMFTDVIWILQGKGIYPKEYDQDVM